MAKVAVNVQVGISCLFIILCLYAKRRRNGVLPLPPGPKKLPIIGNLLDMPTSREWLTYHKWCRELNSDIIHVDVVGTSIIVLDSSEAATDLLEKKSSIYSGRARLPMINELMGWDFGLGFMPYGARWRQHRRLMHQSFHPTAAMRFRPYELKAAHGLLRRLIDEPDNFVGHLRYLAGETIMSIAYGLRVQHKDDPYVAMAERGVHPLSLAGVPGAFLVDSIPALKYVPDWMPGAGFKRKAKVWRKLAITLLNRPFEAAKHNIANRDFTPSFMSNSLDMMDVHGDLQQQESAIKSTAGSMYAAGSDSTVAAIASCILGLLENPEVLRKAQEELDRVLGFGQLPSFDDEASLPYITAIVKEALRWRDVTPMGIPHFLDTEDEYKGYRLPAGSIIIANSWAMLHNEEVYPDPFTFNPDRFMKDGTLDLEVRNPNHAAFGFGRRICPGRYMAFSAIWITVASLLAAFDIKKSTNEKGEDIEPSPEYLPGLLFIPRPFKCSIKPRSLAAEATIRATTTEQYF